MATDEKSSEEKKETLEETISRMLLPCSAGDYVRSKNTFLEDYELRMVDVKYCNRDENVYQVIDSAKKKLLEKIKNLKGEVVTDLNCPITYHEGNSVGFVVYLIGTALIPKKKEEGKE